MNMYMRVLRLTTLLSLKGVHIHVCIYVYIYENVLYIYTYRTPHHTIHSKMRNSDTGWRRCIGCLNL